MNAGGLLQFTGRLAACATFLFLSAQTNPTVARERSARAGHDQVMTTRIATETVRFMAPRGSDPILISPNGKKFAVLLVKGDVSHNQVVLAILSGVVAGTQQDARPRVMAKFVTSGLGDLRNPWKTSITLDNYSRAAWEGNDHLLIFWPDKHGIIQLFRASTSARKIEQISRSATDLSPLVLASSAFGTYLYAAQTRRSKGSTRDAAAAQVVQSDDIFAVLDHDTLGVTGSQMDRWSYSWFLKTRDQQPREITLGSKPDMPHPSFVAKISPDGRYAVVDGPVPRVPPGWTAYKDQWTRRMVEQSLTVSPLAFSARQLKQYYIIDLRTGSSRLLYDAPAYRSDLGNVLWTPDSKSLLIGPTLPPVSQSSSGASLEVLLVEVSSGTVHILPRAGELSVLGLTEDVHAKSQLTWASSRLAILKLGAGSECIRVESSYAAQPVACPEPEIDKTDLFIDENLNTPPRLMARSVDGTTKAIFDPNPALRRITLGKVTNFEWQTSDGYKWRGLLYWPAHYQQGRRFGLVIQTHGVDSDHQFNLYGWGPGEGPGVSLFAAQVLAGHDLFVLQTPNRDDLPPLAEATVFAEGYEAAANKLGSLGLVDDRRVGLAGYSHTGWYVLHALSQPTFRYAAAVNSDVTSGTYTEEILTAPGYMDGEMGGPPFGAGLKRWLRESPGFWTDAINTPVRLELQSGPMTNVLGSWEIFTLLRRQNKPVEFSIVPDINHGAHELQNPRQVASAKDGAVDWFDFWLNGHEDQDPSKSEQYSRWRKLCEIQARQVARDRIFCSESNMH
jgi:dipeptidyl aminopeptidase/acylaminoacyl peptidase